MTVKEVAEAVQGRGFENVAIATIERWVEQLAREVCDLKPWPFLLKTKEGKAPLKVEGLGHVVAVVDVTHRNPLEPITLNELLLGDPTQVAVGSAEYWYSEDGETIKVAPANASATFKVVYRKVGALADIPAAYHKVVEEGTVARAYKQTDNFAAAAEARKDYESERDAMVHALMKLNYDKERRLSRTGRAEDYQ
jgi:hypothetical protein